MIWTPRAAQDLSELVDFIGQDNREAAVRVAERIYNQVAALETMPHMGRAGDLPGTRELVFHPWPYIALYKVSGDTVRIIRIRHASRRWP